MGYLTCMHVCLVEGAHQWLMLMSGAALSLANDATARPHSCCLWPWVLRANRPLCKFLFSAVASPAASTAVLLPVGGYKRDCTPGPVCVHVDMKAGVSCLYVCCQRSYLCVHTLAVVAAAACPVIS